MVEHANSQPKQPKVLLTKLLCHSSQGSHTSSHLVLKGTYFLFEGNRPARHENVGKIVRFQIKLFSFHRWVLLNILKLFHLQHRTEEL